MPLCKDFKLNIIDLIGDHLICLEIIVKDWGFILSIELLILKILLIMLLQESWITCRKRSYWGMALLP